MGHFAVLSVSYTPTVTGVKLTVITDVACHLWMRWSHTPWDVHLVPEPVRGTFFSTKPYYCIVAYEDNEQKNAGDTLSHTFIKEPWEICETRYFHFWGEISGQYCPSESCLLEHHVTEHEEAPTAAIAWPDEEGEFTGCQSRPDVWPDNFLNLIDDPPDEDTSVVRSCSKRGINSERDTYKWTIPPEVTDTITCVTITCRARYRDVGGEDGSYVIPGIARPPGFGVFFGTQYNLTANYVDYTHVMLINPFTTLPWTIAKLITYQFSLKLSPKALRGPNLWTCAHATQIFMTIDY